MTPAASRTLARLTLGLLLLGLLWRTVRYLLAFPIWGDEAMLGMNIVTLDYLQLTQRLDNCQIAPLLFLWGERFVRDWLGSGELAMRLLPYLAGVLGLLLFWRWVRRLLDRTATLCAVGFLAVAIWPVSMGTLLKPYSFDLLMPLLLLYPATRWLQSGRLGWLLLLTFLALPALLASYPAVFVAGSIALALVVPAWQRGWAARSGFVAYCVAMFTGFALAIHIGERHLLTETNGVATAAGMNWYWADAFPPSSGWQVPWWLLLQTTGQMTAYPIGASNGGSTATVVVAILGGCALVRRKRSPELILCVAPILLNLLAAALGRYPYGASGRLSQHLAPGICLLAGLGLAELLARYDRRVNLPGRGVTIAVGVFLLIGVGGLLRDVLHPFRDDGCRWMRETTLAMRARTGTDPVVIGSPPAGIDSVFAWFWLNEGARVGWNGQIPATAARARQLWLFHQGKETETVVPGWRCVERIAYEHGLGGTNPQHYGLLRLVRETPDGLLGVDTSPPSRQWLGSIGIALLSREGGISDATKPRGIVERADPGNLERLWRGGRSRPEERRADQLRADRFDPRTDGGHGGQPAGGNCPAR